MADDHADPSAIPFLIGSHEQAGKLRKHLEGVFSDIALVRDVVIVCLELEVQGGDFNTEIAHVMRRCAADRLHFQLRVLTKVIERLGGKTSLSERKEVSA